MNGKTNRLPIHRNDRLLNRIPGRLATGPKLAPEMLWGSQVTPITAFPKGVAIMETENVQDIVEKALENAIEALNLIATDEQLDGRLREAQRRCNDALYELRGYGYDLAQEDWKKN